MTFHELNLLPKEALRETLFQCCGSVSWVNKMVPFFPMEDLVELLEDAEAQWYSCTEADWREAFTRHPRIGDSDGLAGEFSATAEWGPDEQTAVEAASPNLLAGLAAANEAYEKKFGYIFILSTTGKTAEEMLSLLRERLSNTPEEEIQNAAEEQIKITQLRLQKLIK